jgi:membrane fusion protein (multidrug efflux system)
MKKTGLTIFALSLLILSACTSGNDLDAKKKKLASLKDEQKKTAGMILSLEREIAKLDTTMKVETKTKLVGVDTLKPSVFQHYVDVQGAVDAKDNVLVMQLAPGVVTKILVNVGDHVRKGQVLYLTDASNYESQIATLRTQLSLATTVYEKQDRLWKQNIGSEIQYLQSKTNKEAVETQLAQLQNAIELTKCKSPIDGVVDEVRVKVGDMAAPSQLQPGVRVINNSALVIKAKLSDAQIGLLKVGDMVKANFPDINKTIDTKMTFVGQVVDKTSRTFNIEAALNNKDVDYKANMIVKLLINDDTQKDVLVVPTNVIQHGDDGKDFVLTVDNGIVVKKNIEAGNSYDGKTVIKRGLTKGDKVITFGYSEVVDGQKVGY